MTFQPAAQWSIPISRHVTDKPETSSAMVEDRPNTPEEDGQDEEEPTRPEDLQLVKMEDVITIDPEATDVDLNHGRIGKIERLEPLVKLERYDAMDWIVHFGEINIFIRLQVVSTVELDQENRKHGSLDRAAGIGTVRQSNYQTGEFGQLG